MPSVRLVELVLDEEVTMAKECGNCGFRMGTWQEVATFAGNLALSAAATGIVALARSKSGWASSGALRDHSRGLTAGADNTVFVGSSKCPKCGASGRWMDR